MDDRDLPFVPYSKLSEKRKALLMEMRPDLQKWQVHSMEFRFEFNNNRVAARSTQETNSKVKKLLAVIFPKDEDKSRYPEKNLSSCPTYLTIVSN